MHADEQPLLDALLGAPESSDARLVYIDWLEERGDPRADVLRATAALPYLEPDDVRWHTVECRIGEGIRDADPDWIDAVVGTRASFPYGDCGCTGPKTVLHRNLQDTNAPGWHALNEAIDRAMEDGSALFAPFRHMELEHRAQVVTLPPRIGRLIEITELQIYGSHLVRLPPELGALAALRVFTPYTSYSLHWAPYELSQCPGLISSTVSTRALYGNVKNRLPFPRLGPRRTVPALALLDPPMRPCSVCRTAFEDRGLHRVWITRWVGTDHLPLLVNACSAACVEDLPRPSGNHVDHPHRGGPELEQPPSRY